MAIENILAQRYASKAMNTIWEEENKILLERELWIAIMSAQNEAGLEISKKTIQDYEKEKKQIDLASIKKREKILKHDVKARLEEFNSLSGWQDAHKGLTSRDITENVEQKQIRQSIDLLLKKIQCSLIQLKNRAKQWQDLVITARTHNVPAQTTTMGKRIAMFGEELLYSYQELEKFYHHYPLRGIQGAVGTRMDLLSLFENNTQNLRIIDKHLQKFHQIKAQKNIKQYNNTGQIYPRSLDFHLASLAVLVSSAPNSFCTTLRLMAGAGLASEGFSQGQTGSSAMPHKKNARSCERIHSFHIILKGLLASASELSGTQWNEGDVSCSAARRFLLPNLFFVLDGILETFITILQNMEISKKAIQQENEKQLPFLATTSLLISAVKKGIGREKAHKIIKNECLNAIEDEQELSILLATNKEFPLNKKEIFHIIQETVKNTGIAIQQTKIFIEKIEEEFDENKYSPEEIL